MKTVFLLGSCFAMIASALIAIRQIRGKKPITDLYLIVSILTFFIALRMVGRILGG